MAENFNDRRWVGKPDNDVLPTPEPQGLYYELNIAMSVEVMGREADALGLQKGVSFICVYPYFAQFPRIFFAVNGSLEREPDPDREGDLGTNYFAVAMSKLAYMLATRTNSGSGVRPIRNGEVDYKGGLIITTKKGSLIAAGYSG